MESRFTNVESIYVETKLTLIGESILWQSFFLVLKLSNDSAVDLVYWAKEMIRILYYSDSISIQ